MKLSKTIEDFFHKTADLLALGFIEMLKDDLSELEATGRPIVSPVEQMFYIEWYSRRYITFDWNETPFFLEPQFQDKSTGKYIIDFRVDFLSYLIDTNMHLLFSDRAKLSVEQPKLGIEIDGHIWHEKTKARVQYDKKRERFLIANGWKLLRFTGSEILKDVRGCLNEVILIANSLIKNWHEQLQEFDEKE